MKKFWKVLGITALAAALVPYRVEKDEENGDMTFDALLWQGKKCIRDGEKRVNVNFTPWFSPSRAGSREQDILDLDGDELDLIDDLDLADLDDDLEDLDVELNSLHMEDETDTDKPDASITPEG